MDPRSSGREKLEEDLIASPGKEEIFSSEFAFIMGGELQSHLVKANAISGW
jgi:hypothetical protein